MLLLFAGGAGPLASLILFTVSAAGRGEAFPPAVLFPPADDIQIAAGLDLADLAVNGGRWEPSGLVFSLADDPSVPPQDIPPPGGGGYGGSAGRFSAKGGTGLTVDPTTFLMVAGADYFLMDSLSIGPLLQFGIDDDIFIFAATAHVQWAFDLGAGLERLKPYLQGGMGVAYIEDDDRGGRRDDTGFLFSPGFGVEYYVTDRAAVGSSMLFNILPTEVLDEEFFFSWQVLTLRFIF